MGAAKSFRNIFLVMLMVVFSVGMLSVFAFADGEVGVQLDNVNVSNAVLLDYVAIGTPADGLKGGVNNRSKTLNLTINVSNGLGNLNNHLVNVSLSLFNHNNGTSSGNITLQNTTANQSLWYFTVDSTKLLDGNFNLTLVLMNSSNFGSANQSLLDANITIDNTPPDRVNFFHQVNTSGENYTLEGRNFTSTAATLVGMLAFNVTRVTDQNLTIASVTFEFSNGTGTDFNITAVDHGDGFWNTSYSLGNLTTGLQVVTIHVADTLNNTNNTVQVNFTIDDTKPTATVSCTSGPAIGSVVTCTCSGSDTGSSGLKTATFPDGKTSESSTAAAGGGTSSSCNAVDYAGNTGSATATWTSVAASSGGGGSSGSGGGTSSGSSGTSSSPAYSKKVWTSINSGETASVTPDKDAIAVKKVEFSVTSTVYGAWVKVSGADASKLPSAATSSLTGKVHDYFEITVNKNALKEGVLSATTIDFTVAKAWLTDNGVAESDVVLLRYTDDGWQELSTTKGADDGAAIAYTATTPGFSFFAIAQSGAATGAAVVEAPDAMEDKTGDAMENKEDAMLKDTVTSTSDDGGSGVLWWVIGIVVLGAVVYFVRKRKTA